MLRGQGEKTDFAESMKIRISEYRIMWLFVLFDLPVNKPEDRKRYARFKKFLEKEGFNMMQYSVYIRHCSSYESLEAKIRRVERNLPGRGKISLLNMTDKQFSMIKHYWNKEPIEPEDAPSQMEFF